MKNLLFGLSALALLFAACEKDEPVANDYIVFGHFYGECGGEKCIETYKIENGRLYEDRLDQYPDFNVAYEGQYDQLPASEYEKVKDFPQIPEQLFQETEHVIGQPDAGDWGGLRLQIVRDGKLYFWYLDLMGRNLPDYLKEFTLEVQKEMQELSK